MKVKVLASNYVVLADKYPNQFESEFGINEMNSAKTIPLFLNGGTAFVWNAEDWSELRSKYRICGKLVGSLPSHPRQDTFLGLPMALESEEAALLVEKGICQLLEYEGFTVTPSKEFKKSTVDVEEKQLEDQQKYLKEKRIKQLTGRIDVIVAGKMKKKLSKGITIGDAEKEKKEIIDEEIEKLQTLGKNHCLVQIPTEHPWPHPKNNKDIDDLKPSVREKRGLITFAVYRDLWQRGYHITAGAKFGGDFLVYPGDPVKFHALYIVRCVPSMTSQMTLPQVVAFGRLGVSVNKLTVLATLDDKHKVTYQTLQWHETLA